MYSRIVFLLLFLRLTAAAQQPIRMDDHTYSPAIQTILLYPQLTENPNNPALALNPPVISLDDQTPLQLAFDDLTANYRAFRAKIRHCNADWQPSVLNDIEFTETYNDYPITDYQVSMNTKVPYYHYRFTVPRVKLPGNYVLVIYDERDARNILFTKRFCVYQNRVGVSAQVRFSTDPARQFTDQQIDFSINYSGYQVISPQDDFRVIIRQNYRDDRTLRNLRPTNVRAFDQLLEYKLIDLSNTLPGGNEFRYFDMRTVLSRGNYVDRMERRPDRNIAYIQPDKPRNRGAYIQTDDFNGLYVIDQRETGNGATQADYVETVFTLQVPQLSGADLYVNGAFNLWQLNDRNRMQWNADAQAYQAAILLKQGVYNYDYALAQNNTVDESVVEGSFSSTENDYEIFVYHRPPAARADQLIGYRKVGVNKR